MPDPDQRVDEAQSASRSVAEEEGLLLSPEDQQDQEQGLAEAQEDLRAGGWIAVQAICANVSAA